MRNVDAAYGMLCDRGPGLSSISNNHGWQSSLKAISTPSLDRKVMMEVSSSVPPLTDMLSVETIARQAKETLAGDIHRLVKQGISPNVDVWTPFLVHLPPFDTPDHLLEKITPFYESLFMVAGQGENLCRMGFLCQGQLMAGLHKNAIGFTLVRFETPKKRRFTDLCVICLRLAVTRNRLEGRPHVVYTGMRPFHVCNFKYERNGVIVETTQS